jgi:hypothetical protein
MTFLLRLRSLVVAPALLLLAACTTSPLSRIDSNRALYESWPLEIQEAVLNGEVKPGMTPDMVRMSVGRPTEVVTRSVQSGDDEVWVYRKGGSPLSNTGLSIGGGVGGVSVGGSSGGGGGGYEEENEVIFRDGVVARSTFK